MILKQNETLITHFDTEKECKEFHKEMLEKGYTIVKVVLHSKHPYVVATRDNFAKNKIEGVWYNEEQFEEMKELLGFDLVDYFKETYEFNQVKVYNINGKKKYNFMRV